MTLHFGGQVSPNPVDPPPIDQLHLHSLAIRKRIDIVMFLSAPNNRCVFTYYSSASSRVISSQESFSYTCSVHTQKMEQNPNLVLCRNKGAPQTR